MKDFYLEHAKHVSKYVYVVSALAVICIFIAAFSSGLYIGLLFVGLALLAWLGGLTFPLYFAKKKWKFLGMEKR